MSDGSTDALRQAFARAGASEEAHDEATEDDQGQYRHAQRAEVLAHLDPNDVRGKAVELAEDSIRINAIAPGVIRTPLFHAGKPEKAEAIVKDKTP